MKKKQSKLQIVSLISNDKINDWKTISAWWERYFIVNHQIDKPSNLEKYLKQNLDFLFLEADSLQFFKQNYYELFHNNNSGFQYIVIKKNFESHEEIKIFKSLADDIIHLDKDLKWLKWKTVALLRRHWQTHSKATVIIYKNIIADFIDGFVSIDGQAIVLTPKEFRVFRYLLENRGEFKSRLEIFRAVWNYNGADNTRVVDQIMFKIRQKIGNNYFQIDRKQGVKIL